MWQPCYVIYSVLIPAEVVKTCRQTMFLHRIFQNLSHREPNIFGSADIKRFIVNKGETRRGENQDTNYDPKSALCRLKTFFVVGERTTYLIIQKEPSSESLVHTRNLTGPQRAVVWSASTLFALNNEAKSMDPSEASAILATLASAFGGYHGVDLTREGP